MKGLGVRVEGLNLAGKPVHFVRQLEHCQHLLHAPQLEEVAPVSLRGGLAPAKGLRVEGYGLVFGVWGLGFRV